MKINRFLAMFLFLVTTYSCMSIIISIIEGKTINKSELNNLKQDKILNEIIEVQEISLPQINLNKTVRLYIPQTKEIQELDIEEYVASVLTGEMYGNSPIEALKAVAVAIRTYTAYMCNINKNNNYDVSADSSVSQAYVTRKDAIEAWGEDGKSKYDIMRNAALETSGEVLIYNDAPICSFYHASSYPYTESSENVFLEKLPYLTGGVDTETIENTYMSYISFSKKEINDILSDNGYNFIFTEDSKIENIKNKNLRCEYLQIENNETAIRISGNKIRSMFSLKSTSFDVVYDTEIKFTVYGFGHGVGLSQNGAVVLAESGKTYNEILNIYYNDIKLYKAIYK